MSKVTIDRERITAKMAREYLETSPGNRRLNEKAVNTIADAISRGEWQENGETIKFNGGGGLRDGHHRLTAIAKTGKPCWSVVIRGLSSGAQDTIDTGRPRSVSDVFKLNGIPNATDAASTMRALWAMEVSPSGSDPSSNQAHTRPTAVLLLERLADFPELQDAIKGAKRTINKDPGLGLGRSMVASFTIAFVRKGATTEQVAEFFGQVVNPPGPQTAPGLLRSRLLRATPINPLPIRARAALVVKAWNAWAAGGRIGALRFGVGEEFPAIVDLT